MFKEHHPLEFDVNSVHDLMSCAQEWLRQAAETCPEGRYPLFVWNCLARAGASQFHGHAQVMLSAVIHKSTYDTCWNDDVQVPFPCYETLNATQTAYRAKHPDQEYLDELFAAYDEVGLLQSINDTSHRCDELSTIC